MRFSKRKQTRLVATGLRAGSGACGCRRPLVVDGNAAQLAPTPAPVAPQAPAPAAVAQVIVAETRLEEVQELVAELKVEPARKSDKEPEVEACP